jgi:hypothetical protein
MITMKLKNLSLRLLLVFEILVTFSYQTTAQDNGCIFKDTLLNINFGTAEKQQEFNLSTLKNYSRDYSNCPDDGYYAFISNTSGCFNGDWITLKEDHTRHDPGGKMMLVNSSYKAGSFFIARLIGFKPNTPYEMGAWLMNVCKINSGCPPLPPDILITLETNTGQKLASFKTGLLMQSDNPHWTRYFGLFTTPADITAIMLKMTNTTNGGCGNDFVMDDITFRECYPPQVFRPDPKPEPKPEAHITPIVEKPAPKQIQPADKTIRKDIMRISSLPVKDPVITAKQVTKAKQADIPIPNVLRTRENLLIKAIKTGDAELLIELYDNGIIDGDTVSIYHNNELIISRAGLSAKPISFRVKVNPLNPHHELIMVAENLGSIPPNTSLMVVTVKDKRYEIFISSSEQKNAKILIERKE